LLADPFVCLVDYQLLSMGVECLGLYTDNFKGF